MMNQVANMLKSHGVHKGSRVVMYMPVGPLPVATMLACARIGALHSVVFAGFSDTALATRIQDGKHAITKLEFVKFFFFFCLYCYQGMREWYLRTSQHLRGPYRALSVSIKCTKLIIPRMNQSTWSVSQSW